MAGQFFAGIFSQLIPPLSLADTSLPSFSGISTVVAKNDGSFLLSWAAATSAKPPLRYDLYVSSGTVLPAALFSTVNNISRIVSSPALQGHLFTLGDQSTYFVKDSVYTFGVRAVDSQGYESAIGPVITATAIASGNLPDIFQTLAAAFIVRNSEFQTDHTNFQADHANFQADHANFQNDRNPIINLSGYIETESELVANVDTESELTGVVDDVP